MKKIYLSFLLLGLYFIFKPNNAFAQQSGKTRLPFEITLSAGGEINNLKNLDKRLAESGLEKPDSFLFSGGLGLAYDFNPIAVGAELSAGGSGFGKNSSYQRYSKVYLSTNTIRSEKFIFSPEIGLGYRQFHTYHIKDGKQGTFDHLVSSDLNQARMDQKGAVLDFGISLKRLAMERVDPLFKIGYRYGLKSNEWKVQGATVENAPSDRINSFYFQLLLGLGR